MPLRTVDTKQTKRFEDGEAYLVLRTGGLTKGESDRLKDLQAGMSIDPELLNGAQGGDEMKVEIKQRVAEANRALFDMLASDWSLDMDCTGESYARLDEESGRWVDECLSEVLAERRRRAEGNAPEILREAEKAGILLGQGGGVRLDAYTPEEYAAIVPALQDLQRMKRLGCTWQELQDTPEEYLEVWEAIWRGEDRAAADAVARNRG